MAKVLLIGYNPPQMVKQSKIEAAHYRTWQFLQPLLDDGHEVCLAAGMRTEVAAAEDVPEAWRGQLTFHPVPFGAKGWAQKLQAAHDGFAPDCIVAVNFSHCLFATRLKSQQPIWMDIYGDMLTIMQAAYFRSQSDRGLDTQIAFMREVLLRGDLFSGCGQPQCHMTVGELAMAGRLNRRTFGYEFTRVVLPGSPPRGEAPQFDARTRQLLVTHGVGQEDFVVLWCGGYNTWTDVETLFAGLEGAMAQAPRLHYVSVGASTYEAPDNVYTRFQQLVAQSPMRARFHLLGWRPWAEMATYYRESDVGINIDALHYETLYGTRTRLVEMIAAGLPIVTTRGPELSYLLEGAGAALTFAVGDGKALSNCLQTLAGDEAHRRHMAEAAYRYAQEDLSFGATTQALRAWVRQPLPAPDKAPRTRNEVVRGWEHRARTQMRLAMWHLADADK